jgi:hypothetical protein
MKPIFPFAIAILFLCASITHLNAQSKFIRPGAQWNYIFNNFFIPTELNVSHHYIGDTIVSGDTINILSNTYTNKNDDLCNPTANTWIKQKGDTIYFKNNLTAGTWQILYNFATPAGQSWTTIFPPATGTLNTYVVVVDSVKTVTINNTPLKQLKVRYFGGPYGGESTLITERIGCHLFMFNYYRQECATDQPWFKEFVCYRDNSLGSVKIGYKPCSYKASVTELQKTSAIQLSPNPAKGHIQIKLQHYEPNSTLLVNDALGKKIAELPAVSSESGIEFDTSVLPNGLYFLLFEGSSGSKSATKFMVAN